MTPQEKWERMSNPKTVEDYGIGMTLDEIMECHEALEEMGPYIAAADLAHNFRPMRK